MEEPKELLRKFREFVVDVDSGIRSLDEEIRDLDESLAKAPKAEEARPAPVWEGEEETKVPPPVEPKETKRLTLDEKQRMLHEVEETGGHLTDAVQALEGDDFERASRALSKAIGSTSCGSCQRHIARSGIDADYTRTLKEIKAKDYEDNKRKIIERLLYLKNEYLPKASEIVGA